MPFYRTNVLFLVQIYYSTIRASAADGSTIATSDGVTILPVDTTLTSTTIMDGTPCSLGRCFVTKVSVLIFVGLVIVKQINMCVPSVIYFQLAHIIF